jgi:hypothetical protein
MATGLSETLREAVLAALASGQSVNGIAKAAGIKQPRLHDFLKGGDLTGKNLDKLAAYLGLVLSKSSPLKAKGKKGVGDDRQGRG